MTRHRPPATRLPPSSPRDPRPSGDSAEIVELVHTHTDLADRLARRYHRSADPADLRQVAHIALLLAARRYDPATGPFERYAVVTIIGELKKHLRNHGWSVHVPRQAQEDALTVQATIDRLTVDLGRSPRISEVGEAAGLPAERVRRALLAHTARHATGLMPLDRPTADSDRVGFEDRLIVRRAVADLPDLDRRLIVEVYEHGLSQREIGRRYGMSQSQVQRRLAKILESLRVTLTPC